MLRLYVRLLVKRLFRSGPTRPKRPTSRFRPMLECLETRLTPSTVNWVGGSGDWSNASNWLDATTMTNHTPGAGDDAVINVSGITVTHSTGTDSVNSLTSSDALVLSGGSLSVASASAINNTFTESNGTLGGAGDLSVSGQLTWTGGTMTGTGHTKANGGLSVASGGGNKFLNGRPLDIAAGATLTDNLFAQNAAVITNMVGSTFDIQNDTGVVYNSGSAPTLVNQGTLQKSAGTGTSTIGIALNNSGTVSVQSGKLNLTGGLSQFSGTTLSGGTYLVSGTLQFTGANIHTDAANITLSGSGAITDQSSNNALAGLASVTSGGSLSLQNSSLTTTGNLSNAGTVAIDASSTLTVGGNYTQTGGSTSLNGTLAATTTILQGGVLSGTGTVSGDLQNAASVLIGDASTVGTLTVTGNYTQTSAGNLTVKIGGYNAGTDFDQLVVNGNATVDGTLTVTLVNSFTPNSGDSFTVLTCASETGTFASLGGDGSLFTETDDPADVTLTAN